MGQLLLPDRPERSEGTWQHLPDYGAYHATLIADPALPAKWQPGEEMLYLLVFKGELLDGSTPEDNALVIFTSRLSEALSIPILVSWNRFLWEEGLKEGLIVDMVTAGDCLTGYRVHISEAGWSHIITFLLKEHMIDIPYNQ